MILKYPSLYIRHLQKSEKDMRIPAITIEYGLDYAVGYYVEPCEGGCWEFPNGETVDVDCGLIVLSDQLEDEEEVLTHEWRHHYQSTQLGWDLSQPLDIIELCNQYEYYEDALYEYFCQQHEWDALHFTYNRLGRKNSLDSCTFMDIMYDSTIY